MSDSGFDFQEFNRNLITEFRENGGKVSGIFESAPVLILTTTGAKSGKIRENPLVYSRDGERYVIIASKGGAPTHPDWFRNLVANPEVTIEVGAEKFAARAVVTEGDERARLFRAQADMMSTFDDYQKATEREIPVVALERI